MIVSRETIYKASYVGSSVFGALSPVVAAAASAARLEHISRANDCAAGA